MSKESQLSKQNHPTLKSPSKEKLAVEMLGEAIGKTPKTARAQSKIFIQEQKRFN